MLADVKTPEDLDAYFSSEEICRKYFHEIRWGQWAKCPHCSNERCYIIEKGLKYKCANPACYKKFSVTVKTLLEASNIPLKKWIVAMFLFIKSRGRIYGFDLSKQIDVSSKAEFWMRDKMKFMWNHIDPGGQSVIELVSEMIKMSSDTYLKYQELRDTPFYNNPYHISDSDIDNLSDPKQYDILYRYTDYYMNVYCKWIFLNFASPSDILSESFIYISENGIKEYNGGSIIKIIQRITGRMWNKFISESPKYNELLRRNNKRYKKERRINMTNSFMVDLISERKENTLSRKEIRSNIGLIKLERDKLIEKRKSRGDVFDFHSHFD